MVLSKVRYRSRRIARILRELRDELKVGRGRIPNATQAIPVRHGWTLADSYSDRGISGNKDRRPELNRLMRDAHARKFDVVIFWKSDRFARSVSHLLRALETFNALGIAFVSLSEQMDTTTPAGKMVFTVLGAVAEQERSLIVERVRAGLWNAVAKGKRLGGPRSVVDPARIDRLRAQGVSWRKIARQMEVFGQNQAPVVASSAVRRCR